MDKNDLQTQIEISDEVSRGVYTNLAMVFHSRSEFVMDFVQILPGSDTPKVRSRVIASPEHVKRFLLALGDNVRRYEQTFGEIKLPEEPEMGPFSPVPGEA